MRRGSLWSGFSSCSTKWAWWTSSTASTTGRSMTSRPRRPAPPTPGGPPRHPSPLGVQHHSLLQEAQLRLCPLLGEPPRLQRGVPPRSLWWPLARTSHSPRQTGDHSQNPDLLNTPRACYFTPSERRRCPKDQRQVVSVAASQTFRRGVGSESLYGDTNFARVTPRNAVNSCQRKPSYRADPCPL